LLKLLLPFERIAYIPPGLYDLLLLCDLTRYVFVLLHFPGCTHDVDLVEPHDPNIVTKLATNNVLNNFIMFKVLKG
jgi:hypothetical protein